MSILNRIASRLGFVAAAEVGRAADQAAGHAARRERQEAALHQRQFSAAMFEHFTANWSGAGDHVNVYTGAGLSKVRARSRDAARNNDHARGFIGAVVANVVGPNGIGMQAQMAKRDGDLNDSVNARIEAAWRAWSKRGACDVTGKYSWLMVQRLVVRHLAVDGEALIRFVEGRGPHRFQVQIFDPALLDHELRRDLPNGGRIRMGVEMDAEGVLLAYHIRQDAPGTPDGYSGGRHLRVPADEMLHLLLPEEVHQIRGVPWMQSGLKRMYLVSDYEQAAVNAARNAAKRAGFFTTPDGEAPPSFAEKDGDQAGAAKLNTLVDGQFDTLPEGYGFQKFDSNFPSTTHGEFTKACLRGVASGLGVSYITFGNDLEAVNYSSARVGIFAEREMWKSLQAWLIDELHSHVASRWIKFALIAAPELAQLSPERLPQYIAALSWQPRRWPSIDPVKDREADRMGLELGVTSRRRIAAREGDDLEEIASELRVEQQLFAGLLPTDVQPAAADPVPADDQQAPNPARALRVVASRSLEPIA